MNKLFLLLFLIVSLFSFSACDKKPGTIIDLALNNVEQKILPEKAYIEKYNSYVELNNMLLNKINKVFGDYFYHFGGDEELNEQHIIDGYTFKPFTTNDLSVIEIAYVSTELKPLFETVDNDVKALYLPLIEFVTLNDEFSVYFNNGTLSENGYAKAKELHKRLNSVYNKYSSTSETFFTDFDVLIKENDEKQLKYYQEKGQMLSYYSIQSINVINEANDYFYNNKIYSDNLTQADLNTLKTISSNLLTAVASLKTYSAEDARFKDEKIDKELFFNYLKKIEKAEKTLDAIISRIENKKTLPKSADFLVEEGTPEKLSVEISDAVNAYNSFI